MAILSTPSDAAALFERLDALDLWQRRLLAEWRAGYRAGAAGEYEHGYAQAIADVKAAQHLVYARLVPAGPAWLAAVRRHGWTEYGGTGKPRVPVHPARRSGAA